MLEEEEQTAVVSVVGERNLDAAVGGSGKGHLTAARKFVDRANLGFGIGERHAPGEWQSLFHRQPPLPDVVAEGALVVYGEDVWRAVPGAGVDDDLGT